VARSLCCGFCLFGAIFELHAVNENLFIYFAHFKVKVDFIWNKDLLSHDLYFVYAE
jgi:hypothetical protein